MGGPGTASLLSAIGGAGASTAGALTGKGDAGQPLVSLSQSLNQQDQQRAQLAQQQQQNALQLRRQEIQDARQNFYIEQAGKTFKQTEDQNTLMNTLRAKQETRAGEAVVAKNLKENREIEKDAETKRITADALAVKQRPALPIIKRIESGELKTMEDIENAVAAMGFKEETQAAIMNTVLTKGIFGFGKKVRTDFPATKPASGQPTQKILQYVPATKDTPAGIK